jgi:hypothetical protein
MIFKNLANLDLPIPVADKIVYKHPLNNPGMNLLNLGK